MFTAQELKALAAPSVDAEGGQFYLDDQDWIPNINSAIQRAVTACNVALASKKGSEEQLIELKEDRVFQSNQYGGIAINDCAPDIGHKLWSVMAVYAEPITVPQTVPVALDPARTYWMNVAPVGSKYPVQRMTAEQLAVAQDNMLMSGNEVLALKADGTPGNMRTYAYYLMGKRLVPDGALVATDGEIFIKPFALSSVKPFWVSYLRVPSAITTMADTVDFPRSMMRTLADWTLQYMSIKQGDATTLNSTSQQDAMQLFQMSTL